MGTPAELGLSSGPQNDAWSGIGICDHFECLASLRTANGPDVRRRPRSAERRPSAGQDARCCVTQRCGVDSEAMVVSRPGPQNKHSSVWLFALNGWITEHLSHPAIVPSGLAGCGHDVGDSVSLSRVPRCPRGSCIGRQDDVERCMRRVVNAATAFMGCGGLCDLCKDMGRHMCPNAAPGRCLLFRFSARLMGVHAGVPIVNTRDPHGRPRMHVLMHD